MHLLFSVRKIMNEQARARALTGVSQFPVSEHRDDDQHVPEHIHHTRKDQHAGQHRKNPCWPRARPVTPRATLPDIRPVPDEGGILGHVEETSPASTKTLGISLTGLFPSSSSSSRTSLHVFILNQLLESR